MAYRLPLFPKLLTWERNARGIPDYTRLNTLRREAFSAIELRIDKKWFFDKWSLNIFLDIENITGAAVSDLQLILDRPLDENGNPIGEPIIINPDDPQAEQHYLLKDLETGTGTPLPSIGVMVEI